MSHDRRESGFKRRTRVADARATLLDAVAPNDRTETVPVEAADGRVVAEPIDAPAPVPGYDRAAMDGYAVRASDTFGAGDRSPAVLTAKPAEADAVAPGEAARVHTGSAVPEGADAVVMIEQVESVDGEVEVFEAVATGENVGEAGEVIETNGLTVSRLVERWGGEARYRDVVTDDPEALREAVAADLDADVVVTTGGSSVGERDLIPEVVGDLGEVLVHGVALKPGHPVCLGRAEGTPIVSLPGYPVACIVNAAQFLRPAMKRAGGADVEPFPTRRATLGRKVASEPGVRTFARVSLSGPDDGPDGDAAVDDALPTATPTRASGSGILSSVALADGWVVVPEPREGLDAGESVDVELWEVTE
ncbi:molybdopterin molybdenumtransferase MoeA [Halorubrum ezzemoulense]|nr:molybdopterin molybdenumtransferase MoeA [Halorubrum ezzemoulense]